MIKNEELLPVEEEILKLLDIDHKIVKDTYVYYISGSNIRDIDPDIKLGDPIWFETPQEAEEFMKKHKYNISKLHHRHTAAKWIIVYDGDLPLWL